MLWHCAFLAALHICGACGRKGIFVFSKGISRSSDYIWGRVVYLASLWAKTAGAFQVCHVPITVFQASATSSIYMIFF